MRCARVVGLLTLILAGCTQTQYPQLSRPAPATPATALTARRCAGGPTCSPAAISGHVGGVAVAVPSPAPGPCTGGCETRLSFDPPTDLLLPGGTATVTLSALAMPGLRIGTFIVNIEYDPAVVRPTSCRVEDAGDCNRSFAPGTVRVDGVSISGQFPPPTRNPLKPVPVPSTTRSGTTAEALAELTFQAVGASGTITALTPTAISIVDPEGVPRTASAQAGTLHIVDAGPTAAIAPTDLAFADAMHGWALGTSYPCGRSSNCSGQPVLWATDDGGANWRRLPLPMKTATVPVPQEQHLLFINDNDGWLYDPDLYVTRDGGVTWSETPDTAVELVRVGSTVVGIGGSCSGRGGRPGWCASLAVSSDAGHTWQRDDNAPPAQPIRLLAASAANGVWLLGADDGAAPLYLSSDGGTHWSLRGMAPCAGEPAYADDRIWLLCGGAYGGGWEFNRSIWYSDNGGITWQNSAPASLGGPGYSRAIAASSRTRVFLIGGRIGLLETNDGGRTWQSRLPDPGDGFAALTFRDAVHGWALNGAVWRTTDGGTTWTPASLP